MIAKSLAILALSGLLSAPAWAQAKQPLAPQPGVILQPPRFQIYEAPGQYGGLLLVDGKTGDTHQRVVVNGKDGVSIRWMKIPRDLPLQKGESILWGGK